jgi:hypothetical protein
LLFGSAFEAELTQPSFRTISRATSSGRMGLLVIHAALTAELSPREAVNSHPTHDEGCALRGSNLPAQSAVSSQMAVHWLEGGAGFEPATCTGYPITVEMPCAED